MSAQARIYVWAANFPAIPKCRGCQRTLEAKHKLCRRIPKSNLVYKLTSEEFSARDLVRQARAAEEHGFTFALISDHYHPWTDRQGQSPFVWSVIGAVAQVTSKLTVGTGVTCPSFRIHPAVIAQAAATAATMLPGRFFLGVGTGENLNEHMVGSLTTSMRSHKQ